ncbi:MAG: putative spermidine/putrescine transport system substrate-binding protein [Oleiphilaceae bacterium]|jgi:putative spermidine/putrescine transport system substrate-binding protein
MASDRVVIEGMFSPAASVLNGRNTPSLARRQKKVIDVGVMCLSSETQGKQKDVAYDYMNW